MAVYGYARVSTARQANEGESLDVQERMIRGYASMHNLEVAQVFVEEGVSGSVPLDDRPMGKELLAVLKPDDIVISAKLDRMFRSALDALNVVEVFKRGGVHLHLLDLGGDIASNGLGKLFLTVAAAFAEAERDRIRERVATVKADQKARGRFLGGTAPFGYRVGEDGQLIEQVQEQVAIGQIKALRDEGLSLRGIADRLNAEGHAITHQTVSNILKAQS